MKYIFLFQNTSDKEHNYYFDVNDTDIKIERPREEISLKKGEKKKIVVVLSSKKINDKIGKTITVGIKAYAKDDAERIKISRETIFAYPKN